MSYVVRYNIYFHDILLYQVLRRYFLIGKSTVKESERGQL
jgi:hypothetical protein